MVQGQDLFECVHQFAAGDRIVLDDHMVRSIHVICLQGTEPSVNPILPLVPNDFRRRAKSSDKVFDEGFPLPMRHYGDRDFGEASQLDRTLLPDTATLGGTVAQAYEKISMPI